MNAAQAERAIQALQKQVSELDTKCKLLEAKYKMLVELVSPKCHQCGRVATQRVRIFHGAAKYAVDVWACEEHAAEQATTSEVAA
jgi:uncharacterized protein YoxC